MVPVLFNIDQFISCIGVYHKSKITFPQICILKLLKQSMQELHAILALIVSTTLHLNFTLKPEQQRGWNSVGERLVMYVQIHVISCVWVCSYMFLC